MSDATFEYVHTVRRGRRTYHYSRVPSEGGYISRRLSDDLEEAKAQAVAIHLNQFAVDEEYAGRLLYASRRRAKQRNWNHDLDAECIPRLMAEQSHRCAVTRIPFSMKEFNDGGKFSRPFAPSLDRINSAQGYVLGNVRLVCRIVNFAINVWGVAAVLTMAAAICKER